MNIGDFWIGAAFGGVVVWCFMAWSRRPAVRLFRDSVKLDTDEAVREYYGINRDLDRELDKAIKGKRKSNVGYKRNTARWV